VVFAAAKRFYAGYERTPQPWDVLYAAQRGFRRIYLVMTAPWGIALLVEPAARIAVIHLVPTDTAAGSCLSYPVATMAVLGAVERPLRRAGRPGGPTHGWTTLAG